jgi:hypothetical protein
MLDVAEGSRRRKSNPIPAKQTLRLTRMSISGEVARFHLREKDLKIVNDCIIVGGRCHVLLVSG